jgi:hypothetical protein
MSPVLECDTNQQQWEDLAMATSLAVQKAREPIEQDGQIIQFPVVLESITNPESQRLKELIRMMEISVNIDYVTYDIVAAALDAFFQIEKIGLFDYQQVYNWLDAKRKQVKVSEWFWRSLRSSDKYNSWGFIDTRTNNRYFNQGSYNSANPAYDLPIPIRVLERVKKIEKVFGKFVKFFVSDYGDPKPDPFIMVRPAMADHQNNFQMFIFDVWDEPGFEL